MGDLKNYYADQVSLILCGIPITKGFVDGSFVTVKRMSPKFTSKVGTDGEVTRSRTNDERCTITIRLMQSSDANAALSALSTLDGKAHGGAGVGPASIADLGGTSKFLAEKCWISNDPDIEYDREAVGREWTFECAGHERLDGGN